MESGLQSALSHPDPTRLCLVRPGWLRLDIRPDSTFQQGVTNNMWVYKLILSYCAGSAEFTCYCCLHAQQEEYTSADDAFTGALEVVLRWLEAIGLLGMVSNLCKENRQFRIQCVWYDNNTFRSRQFSIQCVWYDNKTFTSRQFRIQCVW